LLHDRAAEVIVDIDAINIIREFLGVQVLRPVEDVNGRNVVPGSAPPQAPKDM